MVIHKSTQVRLLAVVLFLLTSTSISAQTLIPGNRYTSPDGYVEIQAGNFPLVITVPHDGPLAPAAMTQRTRANCEDPSYATAQDSNTRSLALTIAARVYATTGKHPWVLINRIHRTRMDANRSREYAACGDPETGRAWDQWHKYIGIARASIQGRGFQEDIHGQGHPARRLEIGFLLSRAQMYSPEQESASSSLHAFALTHQGSFTTLLRALGTRLTDAGFPSIPSEQDWTPEPGEAFFYGGYLTERYGCSEPGDTICAVQLEHNNVGIRSLASTRAAYAQAHVAALLPFLRQVGIYW
jgi:hypothetical protein